MTRATALLALVLLSAACQAPAPTTPLVPQVRAAITAQDFAKASATLDAFKATQGQTPEWLEAYSWIGRGHLAANRLDEAERHATAVYDMATAMLKTRPMDAEARLPIAYGAAIEVLAQVEARRGARSDAVVFLERERTAHAGTSIEKRIQKNINLLSLEGTPAPSITAVEHLGPTPPSLDALRGKVVLLFFWAHWCSDCKQMGPVIASLEQAYRDQGLVVLAPTQRYGYVQAGTDATPDVETPYIDQLRRASYPMLAEAGVPLDTANHLRYGVSSTPTIVLVDREGLIRLYHPGQMTRDALEPRVQALLATPSAAVTP